MKKKLKKQDPKPKKKSTKYTPKGLGLKLETKREIDNYSLSPAAKRAGLGTPKRADEQVWRALDIVGQRMSGMAKRTNPKVAKAFRAVRKKSK